MVGWMDERVGDIDNNNSILKDIQSIHHPIMTVEKIKTEALSFLWGALNRSE